MKKFKYIDGNHFDIVKMKIDKILRKTPSPLDHHIDKFKKDVGESIYTALIIATAEAICVDGMQEKVLDLAVGVELLLLGMRLHDGAMHKTKTYDSGKWSAAEHFNRISILSGDYLFAESFKHISKKNPDRVEYFAKTMSQASKDKLRFHSNDAKRNGTINTTFGNYFKTVAGKTALMFILSAYSATLEAGASQLMAQRMANVGYCMAMVFQLTNDALDYTGDSQEIGRIVLNDMEQGIMKYPLISAMQTEARLGEIIKKESFTENDIKNILSLIKLNGGTHKTKRRAKDFYKKAEAKIEVAMVGRNSDAISEVLSYICYRKKPDSLEDDFGDIL